MRFVVTAGPTREPIDPVRFLSNRSSGKMGYAIAEAALESRTRRDFDLRSGESRATRTDAHSSGHDERRNVSTAFSSAVADCDIFVMCAAVSDYKPARVSAQKIEEGKRRVRSRAGPDARHSRSLAARRPRSFLVVGFAAETTQCGRKRAEKTARKKLRHDRRERCQRERIRNGK